MTLARGVVAHKRKLRDQGVADLRKLWLEAVVDDSEGSEPGPLFDRLQRKYDALAQASGK
jgi:antitoxin ParD1/3/4